ncbi:alanine--tRNA ligase [Ahrensia sp. R2A130]|uniref:alanine--tRNA ligase n=1 Tax=Ahrensia sp. R2A130 TaxID=744979 RepID=UPI0001E09BF7|nr:alanine--tRNA ligase [Ahrensia sp. R2A130]EFL90022.1 alanyl-tRNA synthetase [Ahrensia sp. R2A130]
MSGVNDIRSTFLSYFEKNGHAAVDSSPLVPRNDPTLMFTAAGMVQFKNLFTGLETRNYSRATTSQKCVRAGGKHNDLDNVGYTARHHTFFEMLGNFSFGDYFKADAIEFAWNLLTEEYGIDASRLLVTVYHDDDEAFDLWKKIAGLSDDRIIRIATSDNFWAMGDTGPCGPCSEIFYDHGDHIWGGPPGSPEEDGDRFVEIWNLVFMQFEQVTVDERVNLPKPSIDTGMGLERIAAVLQGTHDNYEIDLFKALISASEQATGVGSDDNTRASHRVIADHLRASCFLIADGVLPGNEGRGYVLRRIMRRAMRHASLLGAQDPLMYRLVPALVAQMGEAFPELRRTQSLMTETLNLEEVRFRKTLTRGLDLLDTASADLKAGDALDGRVAFKLYDTYGFPLDLTQDALRRRDITVDTDEYSTAMEEQKAVARASWAGAGGAADDAIWFKLREKHGATEFLGYETEKAEGSVLAILQDGAEVSTAKKGDEVSVILNQTPFYAESGGQMGDTGTLVVGETKLTITDTKKRGDGLFVHMGTVDSGTLKVGDGASLEIDHARRSKLRSNHSATHLVHEALRETLGDHVSQKGSLVAPERLRFDFSHSKPVETEEMRRIEAMANEYVLQNSQVSTTLMAVDDAIELGAQAQFGEKYGDEVRVVSMGKVGEGNEAKAWSLELCGGTHVKNTGDIGLVTVVGESAVSSGVRRIEALTGQAAREYLLQQDELLRSTAAKLKTTPADVPTRVAALIDERKKLERELAEAKKQLALGVDGGTEAAAEDIGGVQFVGRVLQGVSPRDLKGLVDEEKTRIGSGVVAIAANNEDGKGAVVVGVTKDLTDRFDAVVLVRAGSEALGGKGGGGRPDMAQAGGPDGANVDAALDAVRAALAG